MGAEREILARFTHVDLGRQLAWCGLGVLWFVLIAWGIWAGFRNPWNLFYFIPVVLPGWGLLAYGFLGLRALLYMLFTDKRAFWLEGDVLFGVRLMDASTKSIPISELDVISIQKVKGEEVACDFTSFEPYRSLDVSRYLTKAEVGAIATRIAAMTGLEAAPERRIGPRKDSRTLVEWSTAGRNAKIAQEELKRAAANARRRERRRVKAEVLQ
jgi:hypothetical protein